MVNKKVWLVVFFTCGFWLAKNWAKIRKVTDTYTANLEEIAGEGFNKIHYLTAKQKEEIELRIAAFKIKIDMCKKFIKSDINVIQSFNQGKKTRPVNKTAKKTNFINSKGGAE